MTDDHTHQGDDVHSVEAAMRMRKGPWQLIGTEESGKSYIVYAHGYVVTATKMGTHWLNKGEEIFPTHWMPLPAAPTEGE
jgi:hypothetical protein